MSRVNRLNSRGSGHEGHHRSIREREVPPLIVRANWKPASGGNIIGDGPALPDKDKLMKSNVALAEPRFDERFRDVNTSHPSRSGKFPDSPEKKGKRKK